MQEILNKSHTMKPDEAGFLKKCIELMGYNENLSLSSKSIKPRDIIGNICQINHKRAWYLLDKWSSKGWYNYGVTLDLGWFEPEKKQEIENAISRKSLTIWGCDQVRSWVRP